MIAWQLFFSFLKIGFLSFGGGYAVISMIQYDTERYHWLSGSSFQEIVALSGIAPGSIATNCAALIGYHTAGLTGAVAATIGILLPSLSVVILIAAFFFRLYQNFWVKSAFYGLRPVVTGLIAYAALHFGFPDPSGAVLNGALLETLLVGAASFVAIVKYHVHPLKVIAASACAGIILF
jgi:chromate transporter